MAMWIKYFPQKCEDLSCISAPYKTLDMVVCILVSFVICLFFNAFFFYQIDILINSLTMYSDHIDPNSSP